MDKDKLEYIDIPTNQLLGYRGSEKFIRYYTPNLPQTFDGKPLKPYYPSVNVHDPRRIRAGMRLRETN